MGKRFLAQVYVDKRGEWRWRIISQANHNKIAMSTEGYHNKIDCVRMLIGIAGEDVEIKTY